MQFDKRGITPWDYDVFFELLYADALRGMHGTGVLAIDKLGNSQMAKIGGPPHQLVATDAYKSLESFVKVRDVCFMIGHNRYATRGKKITEHAHPFRHGNIILIHNGTLDSFYHFPEHPDKKITVDSEALTYAIDKLGVDAAIRDTSGAWTIVYWDRSEKTLNILRNEERPLWMASQGSDFLAFASEKEMLQWVLDRNHFWKVEYKEVPTDTLLTFSLGNSKPKIRELKGKGRPKKSKEELKKEYDSLFKDDFLDVSGTSEKAAQVVDITAHQRPLIVPSSAAHNRAPTGKVALLAAPRKVDESKKWRPVEHLHDLSRGKTIGVEVFNYDPISRSSLSEKNKVFLLECLSEGYPDIEFHAYVVSEALLDSLIEAKGGVIAKVANILKSNDSTARVPHRIYLHELAPVNETQDPKIPPHAYIG